MLNKTLMLEKGKFSIPIIVKTSKVHLDVTNPRLALKPKNNTEKDILKVLYNDFDLEVLANSFIQNGYFQEEPIIVFPEDTRKAGKIFSKPLGEYTKTEIEKLIDDNDLQLVVAEGNRRIAAIKVLLEKETREFLGINTKRFPLLPEGYDRTILEQVPAIFYLHRKELSTYLGVKHIAGNLKWEAFAKARYIVTRVEEEQEDGLSTKDALKKIQKEIGDRTDTIRKQYIQYKLTEEAEEKLAYNVKYIKERFSLLQVALNQSGIRDYIKVPKYNQVDFNKELITEDNKDSVNQILTWIFGNDDVPALITDSRDVQKRLPHIVRNEKSRKYLSDTKNLDEAFKLSDGELEYIKQLLKESKTKIANTLKFAFNYNTTNNPEQAQAIQGYIEEVEKVLTALKNQIKT
jgi:hypothetical protein